MVGDRLRLGPRAGRDGHTAILGRLDNTPASGHPRDRLVPRVAHPSWWSMEPGTREVWWASTAWIRPWHADILGDGERARRAGLWDPGHRAQYTVAAALLRLWRPRSPRDLRPAWWSTGHVRAAAGTTADRASRGPA